MILAWKPALRVGFQHIASVLTQVHMQDFPISIPGALFTGDYCDDEGGNTVFPKDTGGTDVYNSPMAGVIADGVVFLPAVHAGKGTAAAGTGPGLITGRPQGRFWGDLPAPLIDI